MSTNKKVILGIVVIVAIGIAGLFFVPQLITNSAINPVAAVSDTVASTNPTPIDMSSGVVQLQGGLMYKDEIVGTGAEAVAGQSITVNYVGALQDGTVFDASAQHGAPFTFVLGAGSVIQGWDQGVVGMKVGGKRVLSIPPTLGYGAQAIQGRNPKGETVDVIPANSTLLFEVELVKVGK